MNQPITKLILIAILCICISCKQGSNKTENSTAASTENNSSIKKTQALILTQDFDFDINANDRIKGDYLSRDKLTIPQNLTPQNKWIMFEGPILENDLVAYRYYADSRHRFDIYGKTVDDLVMDTVSWDYHDIMDWGSDILKVGNSLGLGSPAIWYQDSVYTLSDCEKKTIEIIENENNRSTVRTTFKNLTIVGQSFDLQQDWSIVAGQPWCEIHLKVLNGDLPEGMNFATGIVKHLTEITEGKNSENFYAYNWGKQSFHEENMGMALHIPLNHEPMLIEDKLSHAYTFRNGRREIKYKFLSVWERDGSNVKDAKGFKALVEAI